MAEYIKREAAIEAIMSEPPDAHYPQYYAEKIKSIPAADVAPVRPELRKAVKELHKQYERAINSPAVRNPLAWSLYRTWIQTTEEANK